MSYRSLLLIVIGTDKLLQIKTGGNVMGWYGIHKRSGETTKELLFREFNNPNYRIVDMAHKNFKTVYMAYQELSTGIVRASVVLVTYHKKDREIMYKDIYESSGPYEVNCPERILKLLTDTDNEYSLKWRKQCWDNINVVKEMKKKGIGAGAVIQFKQIIGFTNGFKAQVFKLEKGFRGKGIVFRNYNSSIGYRISNWKRREFELLSTEQYEDMRREELKELAIRTGLQYKEGE